MAELERNLMFAREPVFDTDALAQDEGISVQVEPRRIVEINATGQELERIGIGGNLNVTKLGQLAKFSPEVSEVVPAAEKIALEEDLIFAILDLIHGRAVSVARI